MFLGLLRAMLHENKNGLFVKKSVLCFFISFLGILSLRTSHASPSKNLLTILKNIAQAGRQAPSKVVQTPVASPVMPMPAGSPIANATQRGFQTATASAPGSAVHASPVKTIHDTGLLFDPASPSRPVRKRLFQEDSRSDDNTSDILATPLHGETKDDAFLDTSFLSPDKIQPPFATSSLHGTPVKHFTLTDAQLESVVSPTKVIESPSTPRASVIASPFQSPNTSFRLSAETLQTLLPQSPNMLRSIPRPLTPPVPPKKQKPMRQLLFQQTPEQPLSQQENTLAEHTSVDLPLAILPQPLPFKALQDPTSTNSAQEKAVQRHTNNQNKTSLQDLLQQAAIMPETTQQTPDTLSFDISLGTDQQGNDHVVRIAMQRSAAPQQRSLPPLADLQTVEGSVTSSTLATAKTNEHIPTLQITVTPVSRAAKNDFKAQGTHRLTMNVPQAALLDPSILDLLQTVAHSLPAGPAKRTRGIQASPNTPNAPAALEDSMLGSPMAPSLPELVQPVLSPPADVPSVQDPAGAQTTPIPTALTMLPLALVVSPTSTLGTDTTVPSTPTHQDNSHNALPTPPPPLAVPSPTQQHLQVPSQHSTNTPPSHTSTASNSATTPPAQRSTNHTNTAAPPARLRSYFAPRYLRKNNHLPTSLAGPLPTVFNKNSTRPTDEAFDRAPRKRDGLLGLFAVKKHVNATVQRVKLHETQGTPSVNPKTAQKPLSTNNYGLLGTLFLELILLGFCLSARGRHTCLYMVQKLHTPYQRMMLRCSEVFQKAVLAYKAMTISNKKV